MKGRVQIVLATVAVLACVLVLLWWQPWITTPTYQGKTAAQWFAEFSKARLKNQNRGPIRLPNGQVLWVSPGFTIGARREAIESDPATMGLRALGTNSALYLSRRIERSVGSRTRAYAWFFAKLPAPAASWLPAPAPAPEDDIASALQYLGPDAAFAAPALVRSLTRGTLFQRSVYLSALARLPYKPSEVDPAIRTLSDRGEFSDAINLISALHIHTPLAATALINAFSSTNTAVAKAAWAEACYFGEQADLLMPAITAALGQKDSPVQLSAFEVLKAFGPRSAPALPLVVQSLQNGNDETRYQSARVLEAMGTKAQAAIPALWNATNDASLMVQRCTTRALRNLESKAVQNPR